MPPIYEITQEKDEGLKNFKIKLIELCILTLTALFALMAINKNTYLLFPAIILSANLCIILIGLIRGANKDSVEIPFTNGMELSVTLKMKRLTYEFTKWEYWTLGLYLFSIISFSIISLLPLLTNDTHSCVTKEERLSPQHQPEHKVFPLTKQNK